MAVTKEHIQLLREKMGVGIMDAKKALEEVDGDLAKAEKNLKAKGIKKAEKRSDRSTNEGWIGSYVHANGKEAGLIAVACETDFVSRTDDFRNFAHDLALHVVASRPKYVKPEDVPQEILEQEESIWKEQLVREGKPEAIAEKILAGKRQKFFEEICLMQQPFVKDDSQTVEEYIQAHITKLGENIKITGFTLLSL